MKNIKNKKFWNWYLNESHVKNDINRDLYFDNNLVNFLNEISILIKLIMFLKLGVVQEDF